MGESHLEPVVNTYRTDLNKPMKTKVCVCVLAYKINPRVVFVLESKLSRGNEHAWGVVYAQS